MTELTLSDMPKVDVHRDLLWEGSFDDYLNRVVAYPRTVRTAHQRLFDAVLHFGKTEHKSRLRERFIHYKLFDDPFTENHKYAVYDLDKQLMKLVNIVQAASYKYGQESRIILLHGPVGSAKSTIVNLLCVAMEEYSKTVAGQTYMPIWQVDKDDKAGIEILGTLGEVGANRFACPLHEEPLRILPHGEIRKEVLKYLNTVAADKRTKTEGNDFLIEVDGDTCPRCEQIFEQLMLKYDFDWKQVLQNHLRVGRMIFSRSKRIGLAGVRPKSEKDQDASELSGETDFAKLAKFGDTTDPRTFSFKGHFECSNRGIFYAEEMLKAVLGFLYDYLGASQERRVQPKGFTEIDVDLVIIGSTNQEEYEKLKGKKEMAALRDRTIKVDIPYALRLSQERRVYDKWFNPASRRGKHLAPGTIELGCHWAILTRLFEPQKSQMSLRDKLKLYDDQPVDGYTEESSKELRKEAKEEGMSGISPRFVQDQISNAFVNDDTSECVNFFTLINQIEEALPNHQHINTQELRDRYLSLLASSQEELVETLKAHVRRAIGDEDKLRELAKKYLDTVMALRMGRKIHNPVTGQDDDPDTGWLEDVEKAGGITAHDEFRDKIANQLAQRSIDRERDPKIPAFDYKSDHRLANALELFLFEQEKNKINWDATISRSIIDQKDQERIDIIKKRMKEQSGYCDVCASDVLMYVASIFHRGEKAKRAQKA